MLKSYQYCIFALMIFASGCSKTAVSEARKDFILIKDHGWLEISVDIPVDVSTLKDGCEQHLGVDINGEHFLLEPLFVSSGENKSITSGFLIAAPAMESQLTVHHIDCDNKSASVTQSVPLAKDQLIAIQFDGKSIVAKKAVPYTPASLSNVQDNLHALHAQTQQRINDNQESLTSLLKIVLGIGALIVTLLGVILFKLAKSSPRKENP